MCYVEVMNSYSSLSIDDLMTVFELDPKMTMSKLDPKVRSNTLCVVSVSYDTPDIL